MTKSSATSQIEGKNKTIDYKKLYQEQAKKHQLMLSQISHEIRNPVTLINSFLQILERQHPDLSEDQNWIKILENMDFLRGLLGELSSYNNSLRLNLESTNVYALFANVIESINPSLEKKNVSIAFNKLSPIPLLYVDHTKLQQVFHNLLRNAFEAVKEDGHIVCSIESDGTGVTFKVTDDGCGISPEYQNSIFEPFVTYKPNGSGLGLAISKRIAEAHKGSLEFTSSPEKGTTFILKIPIL